MLGMLYYGVRLDHLHAVWDLVEAGTTVWATAGEHAWVCSRLGENSVLTRACNVVTVFFVSKALVIPSDWQVRATLNNEPVQLFNAQLTFIAFRAVLNFFLNMYFLFFPQNCAVFMCLTVIILRSSAATAWIAGPGRVFCILGEREGGDEWRQYCLD